MDHNGQNDCIDCGKPAGGLRCNRCHGEYMRRAALKETAERDRALLATLKEGTERVTHQQLADRLGVTRTRIHEKIRRAKDREEARAKLGI